MMPGSGPSKFKPVDPMRVIRANWLWLTLALIVGMGFGYGAWYTLNKYVPKYTSEAQFAVELSNIDSISGRLRLSDIEPLIKDEVSALTNEPTLRQVLRNEQVQDTEWFKQFNDNMDDALEDLEDNVVHASDIRGTTLFFATATTQSEDDALIILTALTNEFMRQKSEEENNRSQQQRTAAERRQRDADNALVAIRNERDNFLRTRSVDTLQANTGVAAIRVRNLTEEIDLLTKDYNSLVATRSLMLDRQADGDFTPSDQERQQIETSGQIVGIDQQLRQLRVQLASYQRDFGPQHRLVLNVESQVARLEEERLNAFDEQSRTLFRGMLDQAQNGVAILEQRIAQAETALAEWETKQQDFNRELQQYNTELQALTRAEQQAEDELAAANEQLSELRDMDDTNSYVEVTNQYAPTKAKKSFPPGPEILIPGGGVLMLGLVTGLIFLREVMDQRIRSAADVKMVPDATLVGMIPAADEDPYGGKTIERVVENKPSGLLAESFRQLRTSVLSKIDRRGYKTVMLLSAKPSAGVTTIVQNLGASCALSGRRVLIVDANFRRPGMAKLMGLGGQPGLADLLNGGQSVDNALKLIQASQTQGLSLLPAGNASSASVELFESPRFRELMARLEAEFDLVIIDAPPALLTSDAQLLARHVDAMVLVSRARTDTRGMLQRMYRELDGQRADILGIVLNGVQASVGGYLKRNFREFTEYGGPERRTAPRTPIVKPVAAQAQSNGSALDDADTSAQAEDVFDDFDMNDQDEQER